MQPFVLLAGLAVALTMLAIVVSACVAGGRSDDVMEAVLRERERRSRYVPVEPTELAHEPALFAADDVA